MSVAHSDSDELKMLYLAACTDIRGLIWEYYVQLVNFEYHQLQTTMVRAEFRYFIYDSYHYQTEVPRPLVLDWPLNTLWSSVLSWPTLRVAIANHNWTKGVAIDHLPNAINLDLFDDFLLHSMYKEITRWLASTHPEYMAPKYYFTPRKKAIKVIIHYATHMLLEPWDLPFTYDHMTLNYGRQPRALRGPNDGGLQ